MLRPTPVGHRARLQLAGLSAPSLSHFYLLPEPAEVVRPIDTYARLVEAVR